MFIKRFPIIGAIILVAMVLGVLIFNLSGTKATSISTNPPVHNHPTIYFADGQPAISPHADGTLLTAADVQLYVSTGPFPGGPTVKGVQLNIELLKLMTSQEASIQMRGESVGLPDNAYVYYVIVKGPFYMKYISSPGGLKNAPTFNLGEEVFDAQTGNLLVWGIRG